jgi:hypothetical protein
MMAAQRRGHAFTLPSRRELEYCVIINSDGTYGMLRALEELDGSQVAEELPYKFHSVAEAERFARQLCEQDERLFRLLGGEA